MTYLRMDAVGFLTSRAAGPKEASMAHTNARATTCITTLAGNSNAIGSCVKRALWLDMVHAVKRVGTTNCHKAEGQTTTNLAKVSQKGKHTH